MNISSKYRAALTFVGGIGVGAAISLAVLQLSGYTLVSHEDMDEQLRLIRGIDQGSPWVGSQESKHLVQVIGAGAGAGQNVVFLTH